LIGKIVCRYEPLSPPINPIKQIKFTDAKSEMTNVSTHLHGKLSFIVNIDLAQLVSYASSILACAQNYQS